MGFKTLLTVSVALLIAFLLLAGCEKETVKPSGSGDSVVVAGSSGSTSGSTGSGSSALSFELKGFDWESRNCRFTEDDCESKGDEFNAACTRMIYDANMDMICHFYINRKLRVDDLRSVENVNLGKVYLFIAGDTWSELRDDNFFLHRDTEVKVCCVPKSETERLRDKDYDVCQETKIMRFCEG